MLNIRRSRGRLICNMVIPIPEKDGLYIETGPSLSACAPVDRPYLHASWWRVTVAGCRAPIGGQWHMLHSCCLIDITDLLRMYSHPYCYSEEDQNLESNQAFVLIHKKQHFNEWPSLVPAHPMAVPIPSWSTPRRTETPLWKPLLLRVCFDSNKVTVKHSFRRFNLFRIILAELDLSMKPLLSCSYPEV